MLYRLCICLDEKNNANSLKELQKEDIEIISIKAKKNLLNILSSQNCDMFVLNTAVIHEPIDDLITTLKNLPEAPAVVLITETTTNTIQKLYALGCDAVLDASLDRTKLVDSIEGIIENRLNSIPQFKLQNEIGLPSATTFEMSPHLSDFPALDIEMQEFMRVVYKVANSDTSLLITGESGVGKERLARAIHSESSRAQEAFIPINCAALPDSLLESELFGHEKGAYTGATRTRRGAFELAHNGTIFLDEIGDMPFNLQAKFLRVLQERSFSRLGGEKNINVNIRIMAATNSELKQLVGEDKFRKDLFFRLSVVSLEVPPLRRRKQEIEGLVKNYISYFSKKIGTHVSGIEREALEALIRYDWPGNIRELINVIERAMLLSDSLKINPGDLPEEISHMNMNPAYESLELYPISYKDGGVKSWKKYRREIIDYFEKEYLKELLTITEGRIFKSAVIAGLETRSIYNKMKYHGLQKENYKK